MNGVPEIVVAEVPDYAIRTIALLFFLGGLLILLFPQTMLSKIFGAPSLKGSGVLTPIRGLMGAVPLSMGLSFFIFGNQLGISIVLSMAMAALAIGCFLSMIFDKTFSWLNVCFFIVEIILAISAFYYIFNAFSKNF